MILRTFVRNRMKPAGFLFVLAAAACTLLPALSLTGCASTGLSAGMEKWDLQSVEVWEHAKAFPEQPPIKPGMEIELFYDFVHSQKRTYQINRQGGDTLPTHSYDSLGKATRAKVADLAYQLQIKGDRAFVVSHYDSLRYQLKLKRDGAQWSFPDIYNPGDTNLLRMTASVEGNRLILSKLQIWPGGKDTNSTYFIYKLTYTRDSTAFVSNGSAKHEYFPLPMPELVLAFPRPDR